MPVLNVLLRSGSAAKRSLITSVVVARRHERSRPAALVACDGGADWLMSSSRRRAGQRVRARRRRLRQRRGAPGWARCGWVLCVTEVGEDVALGPRQSMRAVRRVHPRTRAHDNGTSPTRDEPRFNRTARLTAVRHRRRRPRGRHTAWLLWPDIYHAKTCLARVAPAPI